MDVTISANKNVLQNEAENKLKYKSLGTEIQRMWNLKCMIIPVIIGATGIVTKSLRKNLKDIPGKHSDRFTTESSYTWNITRNTESTAV
jgi:hypoxanthine-guanine phosphoribosyltransferase